MFSLPDSTLAYKGYFWDSAKAALEFKQKIYKTIYDTKFNAKKWSTHIERHALFLEHLVNLNSFEKSFTDKLDSYFPGGYEKSEDWKERVAIDFANKQVYLQRRALKFEAYYGIYEAIKSAYNNRVKQFLSYKTIRSLLKFDTYARYLKNIDMIDEIRLNFRKRDSELKQKQEKIVIDFIKNKKSTMLPSKELEYSKNKYITILMQKKKILAEIYKCEMAIYADSKHELVEYINLSELSPAKVKKSKNFYNVVLYKPSGELENIEYIYPVGDNLLRAYSEKTLLVNASKIIVYLGDDWESMVHEKEDVFDLRNKTFYYKDELTFRERVEKEKEEPDWEALFLDKLDNRLKYEGDKKF